MRQRARLAATRRAPARSASGCPTRTCERSRSTRRPASGRSCRPARSGTIVLRGPNVFAGYLVRGESGTELRADGKLRDGWLDTGDLGAVDGEGFIHLAGRAKDLIIRGGHNIDPATIEDALLAHPGRRGRGRRRPARRARRRGARGVRRPRAGRPGQPSPSCEAWAAERVPERAAAPRHVEIVEEIPLTAVGKPYKPELRRRAAEQAAKDALSGTAVHDRVRAVLVDGAIEIRRPALARRRGRARRALRLRVDLATGRACATSKLTSEFKSIESPK